MRPPARFGWPAIFAALALALGSFALRDYFRPPPEPVQNLLAGLDFEASGLDVVRYDAAGTPGFSLRAPRAERFRAEDALKLLDAEFELADRDAEGGWQGRALSIEVRPDGEPLLLQGEVQLQRMAEELSLSAPALQLDPQARRAWGDQGVRVLRPGSEVSAQRFEVDLEQSRVELEGRVSGRFRSAG